MGTRNITRVRKDGELRVCQYGQWDGYPTTAGLHILEFIASRDMDGFAGKVSGCTLTNVSGEPDAARHCTGAPATPDIEKVAAKDRKLMYGDPLKSVEDYARRVSKVKRLLRKQFGDELYASYLAATRDTGYKIIDAIDEFGPLALYCDDYLLMEECDWQIEAINEIDLDTGTVRMNWHGCRREYTFDEIRRMDIAAEMESFEAEADKREAEAYEALLAEKRGKENVA